MLAGVAVKFLGMFGTGILSTVSDVIKSKDTNATARLGLFTTMVGQAAAAEVQYRQVVANERTELWKSSALYRLFNALIIGSAAVHWAAIMIDTTFRTFYVPLVGWCLVDWKIPAPPEPYASWEGVMLLSFVGVSTVASHVGGTVASAVKSWVKK